jgi:solute carrier family 25 carnitine/acylcarnitine transporter 20/29
VSIGAVLFSGGMAGVAMWSIAIPPDVIKSRIQSAPAGTYKGFLDCGAKIISQEGVGAIFKGLGPALLRAFPVHLLTRPMLLGSLAVRFPWKQCIVCGSRVTTGGYKLS